MKRLATILCLPLMLNTLRANSAAAQRVPVAHPQQVLFVCEHGTVKSVVALEHFNRLARQRGLDVVAISRGTRPDSTVPDAVRNGLAADGFDVARFQPRPFTTSDLTAAILIVTLDADLGPFDTQSVPISRWNGLPSVMSNYANGRTAIVQRVDRLVDSLSRARAIKR